MNINININKILIIFLFNICIILPAFSQQLGTNTNIMRLYLPPDVYYPPGKILKLKKLDLNKASYEQLLALPAVNEDLALKILSKRPIKTLDDLYNLPLINRPRMEVIINGMSNYVIQPVNKDIEKLQQ